MPDLNLIDEGGFDETPEPAAPPAKRKSSSKGGGGGGGKVIVVLFLLIVILAGGAYYLNKTGKLKLWGKKRPPVAQIQDEQTPPIADQSAAAPGVQKPADTAGVALLETPPPVEENAEPAKEPAPVQKKKKHEPKIEEVPADEPSAKLSDMQGSYTVRVILYKEKKAAVETAKNLEFSGYPSFVEDVAMKGGSWYKVCIGRYPTQAEARKAVKSFASSDLRSSYVIEKVRAK